MLSKKDTFSPRFANRDRDESMRTMNMIFKIFFHNHIPYPGPDGGLYLTRVPKSMMAPKC
jgi:hypothetical protein